MIQIKNAEKLPKKAITRPKPGKTTATPTQRAVMTTRDTIRSHLFLRSLETCCSNATIEIGIQESGEGWMEKSEQMTDGMSGDCYE